MSDTQVFSALISGVLIYAIVGLLFVAIGVAVASLVWRHFEYRVFLNWVNLLNLAAVLSIVLAFVLPTIGGSGAQSEPYVMAAFIAGLIAAIVAYAVNAGGTNPLIAIVISAVQIGSMLYLIMIFLVQGLGRSLSDNSRNYD